LADDELLRVRGDTDSKKLASVIATDIRDGFSVTMRAIGAGAVNNSVKAVAIAQRMIDGAGDVLYLRPEFQDIIMPAGDVTTAIVLYVDILKAEAIGVL